MNPETPPTPREKLEMRLTALLMGELPPEEAAAIRALMATDPALTTLHERLRRAFELLREASALPEPPAQPAPAQLSSERREKLLAHFKTAAPASDAPSAPAPIARLPRRNWTSIVPIGIAAAVIALLGASIQLPVFTNVRVSSASLKMLPKSNREDGRVYSVSQAGTTMTFAGVLQSTPSPTINITTEGTVSAPVYAGDTFAAYTTGLTKSGSGAWLYAPAPPAPPAVSGSGGVYLPPAPPVITSSTAGLAATQQLQNEFPSAPNVFAAKVPAAAPLFTTATTGQTVDIGEDQKKPFFGDLNGQGNITLNGVNAYSGATTVTSGLEVGHAVSGAGIPSDTTIFINGASGLALSGSNTFTGAATGSGTVTGVVTLPSSGSNGDAVTLTGAPTPPTGGTGTENIRTAGAAENDLGFKKPAEIADASELKSAAGSVGNGTLSLGGSNVSANTAFSAASDTLTLASGALISDKNKDAPPARQPLAVAGNGSVDTVAESKTGTGEHTAESPLTLNSNIAIGSLSSNTPENVAPGARVKGGEIDAGQFAKAAPLAAVPAPAPTPGVPIKAVPPVSRTPSQARLKAEALDKERNPEPRSAQHLSAGEAATMRPTTTTTGTGKSSATKTTTQNFEDQTSRTQVAQRLESELTARDASKETPRQAPAPPTTPQPEVLTRDNAFSTFSLNVSDVSFKLAAANLEQGRMPDPASIRSEEFVNAFDYRDPEPAPGAPLAFASERARYPFAQNRDLLRFSVQTAAAGRQPGHPLNIVLLLDKSGSMERADRVNIVREALRVLAAQLQPQDKLSIVTFARTPRLWADGVAGNNAAEMIARVSEITPEGGTNLDAALDLGYATALRHYSVGSISRVVLFTDGAANLGDVDPAALTQKVETHRKKGVALDCFGIGWEGYNDDLLEQLTRNGDGRYGFINTPEEAASNFAAQLAGALQIAASDVKTQVEFNPRRVKAYRQIGYAKHQLTKEQFRDNSVNAAQIGAAESGNALYIVEVDPQGEGDLATVRVRFRVPGTNDYREHEWAVPFNGNAPLLEQSSPALRLAGTAAAFSEMLAASPYATEVTSDRLIGLVNGVPQTYGADPRPKKLEWMIRQAKILSGH